MTIIHIVQKGETIYTISELYGVTVDRLIAENDLPNPNNLLQGQAIVITIPTQTYIIQEGDTLQGIADQFGVPVLQLLRNNPEISNTKSINPGETIIISYDNNLGTITTNGFTNEYIQNNTLEKTLPFLTYISVFGYRLIDDGNILTINDEQLLNTIKGYGVAPLMILTTLSNVGKENVEAAYKILSDETLQDTLIDKVISILKEKGYSGVNLSYELLNSYTLAQHENVNSKLYQRLKSEGFKMFISISPNIIFAERQITFENINYSQIFSETDGIIILHYLWGSNFGPPTPVTSLKKLNEFLDYIIPLTSPEKIVVGVPLIGYDWELPYTLGLSTARSLSYNSAILLASQYNSTIFFDEISKTPYFTYYENVYGILKEHIVWFVDARTIDAILSIIKDRGLSGSGLWNIMIYNSQLWLLTNSKYEIVNFSI